MTSLALLRRVWRAQAALEPRAGERERFNAARSYMLDGLARLEELLLRRLAREILRGRRAA